MGAMDGFSEELEELEAERRAIEKRVREELGLLPFEILPTRDHVLRYPLIGYPWPFTQDELDALEQGMGCGRT
jgi:hypothetical protein